jgi:O-antigen/teichoic acid export membrane protein
LSLRRIALGTATMSMVNLVRLSAQFFAIPILARRLSPVDYGIVGMALPIMAFSLMIADAGVGMSLIRSSASSRRVWSTCFWLSVFLGASLAAIMTALAPIASGLLHEPRVSPVIVALAVVVLTQSVIIIPMTALQQQQRFNIIAIIELGSVAISIGVAVLIAICGGGVWALVCQQLSNSAIKLLATLLLSPFRPLLILDLPSVMEHVTFSREILTVNMIVFLTKSLDNFIIGSVLGAAAVGVYSMTWLFLNLPLMLVTGPLQYVLYAQLAEIKHELKAVCSLFQILTRVVATLAFPVIGMIAVAHESVFGVILSGKWAMSGDLFLTLAPTSVIKTVTAIGGTVMLALGRVDIQRKWTTECGVIWLVILLVSARFGLDWLALAYSTVTIAYVPRLLMLTLPLIGCAAYGYAQVLLVPAMVTLASTGAFLIIINVAQIDRLSQLAVAMLLAIGGVAIAGLVQRNALFKEIALWRDYVSIRASAAA